MAKQTQNESHYWKKVKKRKLSGSLEFTTSRFAWQITAGLVALLLVWQFVLPLITGGANVTPLMLGVIGVYTVEFLLQLIVAKRIENEVTATGEVADGTRKLGWLLIPFVVTGNFFMFIAGAMLVKKEKNIEYQLGVYSFLVTIFIIVISLLNLFFLQSINFIGKYVSNTPRPISYLNSEIKAPFCFNE